MGRPFGDRQLGNTTGRLAPIPQSKPRCRDGGYYILLRPTRSKEAETDQATEHLRPSSREGVAETAAAAVPDL